MDFVAIDVETANPDLSSICQIGIAKYKSTNLVEGWKTYVDPDDYFCPVNMHIHGIDESVVQGSPKLNELASELYDRLDNHIVVCHTHFDRAALNRACNKYNLRIPKATWLDSARVARRTWEQFAWSGYGLANICWEIGYRYECHDALEDAKACAMVFIAATKKTGFSIDEWLQKVENPISTKRVHHTKSIQCEGLPTGYLYGDNLVFTGSLRIPREVAAKIAAKLGCNVQMGVNKETTILVVGKQDIRRLSGREKSSKHRKAELLIMEGQQIRILQESDFMHLVDLVYWACSGRAS